MRPLDLARLLCAGYKGWAVVCLAVFFLLPKTWRPTERAAWARLVTLSFAIQIIYIEVGAPRARPPASGTEPSVGQSWARESGTGVERLSCSLWPRRRHTEARS